MDDYRNRLITTRRWVIKIGSALLTTSNRSLDINRIQDLANHIANLRNKGYEVVLVSSGSVAAGMQRLGWYQRPRTLNKLQAAAAIGQMGLIQTYEAQFQQHNQCTAQVLLTHDDLTNRNRYINARSTLRTLISLGVVPIINENDTVATEEIRFGDNDTLSAMVANLIEADLLVILTDQAGLFNADPRHSPNAQLIPAAAANDPTLDAMASSGTSALGRGGMITKIKAARRAGRSGTTTVIASGKEPSVLQRIAQGEAIGTLLWPNTEPLAARKQWLAGQLQTKGFLQLDSGAIKVISESGRSLLPVGVLACDGHFARGELVSCIDPLKSQEIARGLINYNAEETRRILGRSSSQIEQILGYISEEELIHRDNLVLL
ncbi:glutamate 5-kinase [Candidatus Nitrosoglobus terrae]|uniref:Glutamate 5-kinase n=1 Tax=Candidatus Nitrosoglobus terrae TaxID=1630141 RepID=A0A1Q2SJX6_9GAMM|nr:glutamate 5-kinase [Candidatus Nitrosoglobus terrae]BAW79427.1 glutamate 5-kinase [Candidatus Nitrosoglobus terrae]